MIEREAFEKWISGPPYERSIDRYPDDPTRYGFPNTYREPDVDLCWLAYQEAIAQAEKVDCSYGNHRRDQSRSGATAMTNTRLQQLLAKLRDKEREAIENGGVAEVHFIDLADAQRAIVELIERNQ